MRDIIHFKRKLKHFIYIAYKDKTQGMKIFLSNQLRLYKGINIKQYFV